MISLPEELTVAQAAKTMGLQRYTIRDAIHRGELPAKQQKIPGGFQYLIPLGSLKDFGRRRGIQSSILGLEGPEKVPTPEESPETKEVVPLPEETPQTQPIVAVPSEVTEFMHKIPQWEQRMEQLIEQMVEVQADVLGLKKGVHQHLSKVESRVVNVQQSVNGELKAAVDRLRHNSNQNFQDVRAGIDGWHDNLDALIGEMRASIQDVAASQTDSEMRQAFVHKLTVDNQSTVGEVKKLLVDVNEVVSNISSQQDKSTEMLEQHLEDMKNSVDGVKRSVDRTTDMIIKWRHKTQREQSKPNNSKGIKGWFSRFWGSNSPALSK
ncbi:hypothetical protein F9B85_12130 [Heliorestis acidaminivorans]|uniref:Helix-turn-helix domain-containing protein n=1 Tax=Heliorestis acidaminivorans TaxID=553427 RepID=A0A6I0EY14_9FIRM|nr:hypothetical protein [Heliorestis acidaminivorans]KAB2951546.1 hypothetical protein F9B85_12130 [Heliorestis acidaminivorans]